MTASDKEDLRAIISRSRSLSLPQRLVVMVYATSPAERSGLVRATGKDLAETAGMSPTVFSRIRKQLVQAGWLEECERFAHISYYRLTPLALGRQDTVVPMRRAM